MITGLCNVARKLRTELTEQYPDIHLSTGISNDVIYLNYTNSQKLFDVLNTVREIRNRYHVYDTYEKCYKTASIITCRDISESYIKIVADFFEEHYQMSKYSTNVTVAVSQWIDSHDLYEPPLLNVKSQINDMLRAMKCSDCPLSLTCDKFGIRQCERLIDEVYNSNIGGRYEARFAD